MKRRIVKRIAHVCIQTSDLARAERFYCSVLGLKKRFEFMRGDKRIGFYLSAGGSTFIEVFKAPPAARKPAPILHFCLEVDDIQSAYRHLKKHGIEATKPKLGCDRSWQTWFNDPDGIAIEFHAYTAGSRQKTGGVCQANWA